MYKIVACSIVAATMTVLGACQKNDTSPAPPDPPKTVVYTWQQFVMGSDMSYVNIVETMGGVYKVNNAVQDPFTTIKSNGNNTVRVRLWHNPSWQAGLNGGAIYGNLADVTKTIQRAKNAGMAVNLDIHYSDSWTDPGKQEIPASWKGLPLNIMADSVYNYTKATLEYLAAKNLVPEMIQVGNETNSGMLWPVGKTDGGWTAFATLIKSGIKAVRDFSTTSAIKPKIILHEAQLQSAVYWTTQLKNAGVTDYDILGLSHYYKWSTVNNWTDVSNTIAQLKTLSGKDVMIVETAFPFTNANADSYNNIFYDASGAAVGYNFSPEGQKQYYTDLVKAIVKGGGKGVMLWEPGWITSNLNDGWGKGSSWENNAFWDYTGNLHAGIQFMTVDYGL